ncbi:MAG: calcium-binding protein [Paracoccus sp. (in: a-proteobacteria)]
MINDYTMGLAFWWGLSGFLALLTFYLNNSAGDDSADTEPPTDPVDNPDFNPDDFDTVITGTENADVLLAPVANSAALVGLGGNDSIEGSGLNDFIDAGAGDDEIFARPGNDTVHGGDGDDRIDGGLGDDQIFGGDGADAITGNGNDDTISGGAGDDQLSGNRGSDQLLGGDGNDTLSGLDPQEAYARNQIVDEQDGPDTLEGGQGDDELWLGKDDIGSGGDGADRFIADHRGTLDDGSRDITDFNRAEDELIIFVNEPDAGQSMPEITQEVSDDGADIIVSADGQPIVRLIGEGPGGNVALQMVTETPS